MLLSSSRILREVLLKGGKNHRLAMAQGSVGFSPILEPIARCRSRVSALVSWALLSHRPLLQGQVYVLFRGHQTMLNCPSFHTGAACARLLGSHPLPQLLVHMNQYEYSSPGYRCDFSLLCSFESRCSGLPFLWVVEDRGRSLTPFQTNTDTQELCIPEEQEGLS